MYLLRIPITKEDSHDNSYLGSTLMQTLLAIDIGSAVQLQAEMRVHSVFGRACNMVAGNELMALVDVALGPQPFGIGLALPPGFRFDAFLQPTAQARLRGTRLTVGPLQVDLQNAKPWTAPQLAMVNLHDSTVQAALETARAALLAKAPAASRSAWLGSKNGEHMPAWARAARSARQMLLSALMRGEMKQAVTAHNLLVGLGPGLTPAGDDFLVGLFLALAASSPPALFFAELDQRFPTTEYARQTTAISAAYLTHARRALFAEPLSALAAAIAQGASVEEIRPVYERALAVGHSSGADGVAGLVCGLMLS